MSSSRNSVVRFGVFQVNLSAREIHKHGVPLHLPPQPFTILALLLERPGEVVTREQIRLKLWSTDTFVDFEHSLNSAIKRLRSALGDSARNSPYIQTVPRVGYRFIAPVEWQEHDIARTERSGSRAVAVADAADSGRVANRLLRRTTVALIVSIIVIAVTAHFMKVATNLRVVRVTALTSTSRADRWGRIQTDGSRLFFLERRGHRWALMQMAAAGGDQEPFSAPFNETRIVGISRDGSEMIVSPFTERAESLPLYLMPTVGGPPRRLGAIMATDAVLSPDRHSVAYSAGDGIYVVGRDGAGPRAIFHEAGLKRDLDWSPDGRALRFSWEDWKTPTSSIWEVAADGSYARSLLPGWDQQPSQCCGRWTAEGRYYVFVSHNHGGSQNIWAIPERQGLFGHPGDPVQLSNGPITMDQPLPSSDGRRVFTLGSNERTEYIRYDPHTREYRALIGVENAAWPNISNDGEWVVYCNADILWRSRVDGSERRQLASEWFNPRMPRLSADGRVVVFAGSPQSGGVSRIYEVSTEAGVPHELVSENFPTDAPYWSPDGSAVLYSVPKQAGAVAGLYVLDRKTGAKTKVPESFGFWKAAWSPDGKFLAAVQEGDHLIAIFEQSSHHWTTLAKGAVLGPAVWSSNSHYVYVQDVLEQDEPVRRVEVGTLAAERVFDCRALLQGNVQRCGFEELTPDGALVMRLSRGDHDVYSLELEHP
jgi:DNA-binding winged helix-turn-helix (wHTH) protein/Tol biopolymer transport system component